MVTRERVIVLAEKNIFLNWAKLGRTEAREAAEWNILLGRGSIKIYRIWRHKGRTPTENVPKLFWVCVSLTACWDWGLQGLESAVFGVCSKSQTLSFSFHYLHKAVTWWRGLASLCTAVLENSLLQHRLEIHHWSKPLTFKSFADPFSYDMWSIENPSVHHHVCAVVQGRALVHCGNSSLQDRSCEIVQKGRCAMEQESTYSSLGHLHQKKKKKRTWAQYASVMDYVQPHGGEDHRTQKALQDPLGTSAALRGHQDSGISLGWAVFDSTSAFSIVTESLPAPRG